MVNLTKIASELIHWYESTYLGGLDSNKFKITIYPQVGDYRFQPVQGKIKTRNRIEITGTLTTIPVEQPPILGYGIHEERLSLNFIVPTGRLSVFMKDMDALISYWNGKMSSEGSWANADRYMYVFSSYNAIDLSQRPGAGSSVELVIPIRIIYLGYNSSYGTPIMSNEFTVRLGCYINSSWSYSSFIVLQSSFITTTNGETTNVSNSEFSTLRPDTQILSCSLKMAYISNTVSDQIVKDIFTKKQDTKYRLTFYKDSSNPLLNEVELLPSQISLSMAQGSVPSIDINLTR